MPLPKPQADTKHTPGPWEAIGMEIGGAGDEHIATVNRYYSGGRGARNDANATLIAASPDLHAALVPFADLDGEGDDDMPDETPVTLKFGRTTIAVAFTLGDLRRARAAIAKAEGRA